MKKYRLKQGYPSLPKWVEIGAVAKYIKMYECYFISNYTIQVSEVENNPDFWELIEEEKPLFITEDGVEIFLGHSYILIDKEFIKHKQTASNIVYTEYFKKFKHESNADEYIWRNKRVFSYNDVMEFINLRLYTKETIEHDAKERSKE